MYSILNIVEDIVDNVLGMSVNYRSVNFGKLNAITYSVFFSECSGTLKFSVNVEMQYIGKETSELGVCTNVRIFSNT